jgi:dihydrolipoamide dehydrogenase
MQKRKTQIVKQSTAGIASLLKGAGVTALVGHGKLLPGNKVEFTDKDGKQQVLSAKHVVLASGSVPTELKSLPFDGKDIVDSWGALEFAAVPKRLGVIVVLEAMDAFLPVADKAVASEALKHLKKQGLDIRLGAKVSGADKAKDGVVLKYTDAKGDQSVTVDKVVVAVGRRPFTKNLLADGTGVELDERGFVKVDHECRTAVPNVWAVGDLVRGPMLAHKGKEEGVVVADLIAGLHGHVNYDLVPSVIYTAPEIAWVGQTEEQVKAGGRAYKVGSFPFMASGRARAMEAGAGFCKMIVATDDDRILGVHIIGPMAGELLAEAVLAMEYSASAEDLQRTMHAHPTLSEALHEAALAADKRAIDFPNR